MYNNQYGYLMQPPGPFGPYPYGSPYGYHAAPYISHQSFIPTSPYLPPFFAAAPQRPMAAAGASKFASKKTSSKVALNATHSSDSSSSAVPEPDGSQAFVADKYKTNFCRAFEQGRTCTFGFKCMFAHSNLEKRTTEMNIRDGILTVEDVEEFKRKGVVSPASVEHPVLAERFKTHFCRSYEKGEVCPYGHRCIFAHTQEEKRTLEMNLRDELYTLEAIEAFKRTQPPVAALTLVRVGNGVTLSPSLPPSTDVTQSHEDVALPDPAALSNCVPTTTAATKRKKQRGRYKPRCLKGEGFRLATTVADNNNNNNASLTVVTMPPWLAPYTTSQIQSRAPSYDNNGQSFINFAHPTAIASSPRNQPRSQCGQSSEDDPMWGDSASSASGLLQGTLQALIDLTAEEQHNPSQVPTTYNRIVTGDPKDSSVSNNALRPHMGSFSVTAGAFH